MNLEKFIPCRKCKHQENSEIPDGYIKVEGGIKECECHKKWVSDKRNFITFKQSGFNPSFFDKSFNDYVGIESIANIERLKNYIKCFDGETRDKAISSIIYFYGINGTQKTSVANYIAKQLIEKKIHVNYILMKELIDRLWSAQRDEDSKYIIEKLSNTDVLIIDEAFSKDKIHLWASGNQLGYIDEFIRERINKNKGIIFISNTQIDDIENQGFSHSIQDLVLREVTKRKTNMIFKDNYMDNLGAIPDILF